MSDNNSTRKMDVGFIKKPDGKRWVYVDLIKYGPPPYPRWIPAFLDLHRIIQAIAECEDERYPPPLKGRNKLIDFLVDAVRETDFKVIARKYQIPIRDGDRVIETNGAAVPVDSHQPLLIPLTAADIPGFKLV